MAIMKELRTRAKNKITGKNKANNKRYFKGIKGWLSTLILEVFT